MMPGQSVEQMWIKARSLQDKGKLSQAWKMFRDARRLSPKTPGLALETGVLEAQMGRIEQAVTTLREAVRLEPSMADAHFNLAEALSALDRPDEAAQSYAAALKADPSYVEAHLGLGRALRATGQFSEAVTHLRKAAGSMPGDLDAHTLLGATLADSGETVAGLKMLAAVTAAHPADLDAGLEFLRALNLHGRANQVARHVSFLEQHFDFKQLIARLDAPDALSIARLQTMADAFQTAGRPDLAGDIARRFMKRRETRAKGALILGSLAAQDGDFDTAAEHLDELLKINPSSASAMQQLALINRLPMSAEPTLKSILDSESASDSDRITAGSALYHLLSRNDRAVEGFEALQQSKAIRASKNPYDAAAVEQLNLQNEAIFTPSFFEARGQEGFMGEGCIFIVGMMRSGTTLTEQILAAHSRVYAGGERGEMMSVVESLGYDMSKVASLPADWARKTGEMVHAEMFRNAGGATFATDKLPGNVDYIGLIRFILPKARFIYTHRTPEDCALSNFEQMFADGVRFSFDLKALGHKYAWHEDIARYWIEDCRLDVYDLDYETLVNDPEPNIRKLLDFCGLEFEENCLYPNEVKREIRTASVFQVRQPISAKSVGRWRKHEQQMKPFSDELSRQRAIIAARRNKA